MNNGNHNTVQNNTIDGKWDGSDRFKEVGADDGIVLFDESDDIIKQNTIQNNWDCGIETYGLIQNTKIIGNTITKSGICGIGAWYYNSWKNNLVADNVVDSAPKLFLFFRLFGLRSGEDFVYFTDNTFSNNKFLNPTGYLSSKFSFHGTRVGPGDEKEVTEESYVVKNNTFSKNDFNAKVRAPLFDPSSMAVDGGGNICGVPAIADYPNPADFPLKCVSTPTPTPVPTTLSLELSLTGIGNKTGDNHNPLNKNRNAVVEIYKNLTGVTTPLLTKTGTIIYDVRTGTFKGVVNLGDSFATGTYIVKVKVDKCLKKQVKAPVLITSKTTNPAPLTILIVGDINGDNLINLLDRKIITRCFNKKTQSCVSSSDLNDDGKVDGVDLNLFLRSLGRQ